MTQIMSAVSGDVGDTRVIRLDGIDDLTTATAVEAHVWLSNNAASKVTLAATVLDAAARTVTVQLGGVGGWLPTAVAGIYNIEIEVTFGAVILTWPVGRPDTIEVRSQGD